MEVGELMSRECCIIRTDDTLEHAAQLMIENDVGALPVREDDRLVGMLTDRDIVARCVATGKDCKMPVREAMTPGIKYCFEHADLDSTLDNMAELQLRRLPVMNDKKRLVGIIALADAARGYSADAAGVAYSAVAEPPGNR